MAEEFENKEVQSEQNENSREGYSAAGQSGYQREYRGTTGRTQRPRIHSQRAYSSNKTNNKTRITKEEISNSLLKISLSRSLSKSLKRRRRKISPPNLKSSVKDSSRRSRLSNSSDPSALMMRRPDKRSSKSNVKSNNLTTRIRSDGKAPPSRPPALPPLQL